MQQTYFVCPSWYCQYCIHYVVKYQMESPWQESYFFDFDELDTKKYLQKERNESFDI